MSRKLKNRKSRKGQALVEYTIILASVALIRLGTISLLGHKTADMLGTLTAILPGATRTTTVRSSQESWCRLADGPKQLNYR